MRASRWLPLVSLLVALFVLACGGSDGDPAGPGPADGPRFFRARIDGADWSVSSTNVAFAASHTSPGLYVLIGQVEGGHRIQIVLSSITGPGTYPLGVGAGPRGGNATLSLSPSTWLTPLSGAAGSITFTALSDTHMVGTFAFTAAAVGGTPASTKDVTEGVFDLAVTTIGNIGPVPDNAWSEVRTTIAGAACAAIAAERLIVGHGAVLHGQVALIDNGSAQTTAAAAADGSAVAAFGQAVLQRQILEIQEAGRVHVEQA